MELISRSPSRRSNRNQKHCVGMTDIPDNLLFEILHHLPLKSAKQCMLVSKLWYSLMSSPYFAHRLLEINHSSALVLLYEDDEEIPGIFVPKENSIIKSELFSFSYLPFEQGAVAKLVAWCQDLVLCQVRRHRSMSDSVYYYICNPLTRSWIRLPPIPPVPRLDSCHGLVFQGFGHSFKYALLRIPFFHDYDLRNYLKVQIFTSESGIWKEKMLTFRRNIRGFPESGCISYKGMFFWVDCSDVVIGVDPFIEGGSCRLIDVPPSSSEGYRSLSVCYGILRLMATCYDDEIIGLHIRVWDLNDYENGEWHLQHNISFPGLMESKHTTWFVNMPWMIGLACDPKDGDIVYLHMGDNTIVLCNMRKKMLDVVRECDDIFAGISVDKRFFPYSFVYEVPWQTTSFHSLPVQNMSHDV